jgi:hypothetical protein
LPCFRPIKKPARQEKRSKSIERTGRSKRHVEDAFDESDDDVQSKDKGVTNRSSERASNVKRIKNGQDPRKPIDLRRTSIASETRNGMRSMRPRLGSARATITKQKVTSKEISTKARLVTGGESKAERQSKFKDSSHVKRKPLTNPRGNDEDVLDEPLVTKRKVKLNLASMEVKEEIIEVSKEISGAKQVSTVSVKEKEMSPRNEGQVSTKALVHREPSTGEDGREEVESTESRDKLVVEVEAESEKGMTEKGLSSDGSKGEDQGAVTPILAIGSDDLEGNKQRINLMSQKTNKSSSGLEENKDAALNPVRVLQTNTGPHAAYGLLEPHVHCNQCKVHPCLLVPAEINRRRCMLSKQWS